MKSRNQKQTASVLAMLFVLVSLLSRSWDDLVAHLSLGIAIGLVLASALFIPRERETPKAMDATGSISKTIAFWGALALLAVFAYQLVRGPVH